MRFVGRGHPAIRATHDKTLEFAPGPDVTERGTCIVAVSADPPGPVAGPIAVTISTGGAGFTFDAMANPCWEPGGPVVVRRSPLRLPGTFATEATAAAADLPRDLVAGLQDPAAQVHVEVTARPADHRTVVLFLADATAAHDPRLVAELAVADVVLAEDADALRLVGRHAARPGDRTLIVATRDLPGRSAPSAGRIETVGLAAPLAAAAASPTRGPVTFAGPDDDVRQILGRTPAGHRIVVAVHPDGLDALLALARDVRGTTTATVAQDHGHPVHAAVDAVPRLPGVALVHVCLPAESGSGAIDPGIRSAVRGLLADGVPTKTAAKALAALTGWERRRAYETVLAWRAT